jgi:hypothetical protein
MGIAARVLIGLVLLAIASAKLVYVQEVFRHGARYPIYPSK